ncbi:hypothetical protein B1H39_12005 [Serratia marcescens]|nr:hypothetical protein B1H39_12005 [Serratia marcescens]OPJ99545.1 hypothetical protein B1R44_07580 [Serratia marcescens]
MDYCHCQWKISFIALTKRPLFLEACRFIMKMILVTWLLYYKVIVSGDIIWVLLAMAVLIHLSPPSQKYHAL